ncbi:hypothetical protein BT63DRAFT_428006 [Microthyrium microscopicum]|uniref:DNA repair protein RAD16 n=1 Tax=Microthyrium microscopicum TaxID=703497 RepID=A0A6A6U455_9PEZI|nr:hypothetical protein BT63DRAFT_428006 [Microthyrium microscopicum]
MRSRSKLRASLRDKPADEMSPTPGPSTRPTRSFRGVVVPSVQADTDSVDSKNYRDTSTRSASLASETPDTSMVVTPAESLVKGRGRGRQISTKLVLGSANAGTRGRSKRKSSTIKTEDEAIKDEESVIVDTSKDAELALRLQKQEYKDSDAEVSGDDSDVPIMQNRMNAKKRSRRSALSDSESELSDYSIRGPAGKRARHESDFNLTETEEEDELSEEDIENDVTTAVAGPSALMEEEEEIDETLSPAAKRRAIKAARRAKRRGPRFKVPRGVTGQEARKMRRRMKLENSHPEITTMWDDLAKLPVIKPVQAPQPESITRELKSFQREGLDWMIKQEKSTFKGGLLGDEMGMGKTIQAVSLIMSDYPAKAPSLVLVPPVALMQWSDEIESYTDGKLKVLVVHGSNTKSKNLTVKAIKQYNVLVMSYNTLESAFRKQEKGWSRGENIIKADSAVHAVKWHRVILDEAHSIKSRNTGQAKACFALNATYKWCLSGTPVQNRIGEFFSLLRFLECRPFADYFCEACDCAELHWAIDTEYRCTKCRHSSSEHRSVFNEEILNPITGDSPADRDAALDKLHMLTDRIMLRRLKKDYTASMELPPKLVQVRNEFFSSIERDFSSSIMSNTVRQFDTYVSRGVVLNNYANIFGLIMQMRQVANHPDLILRKHSEGGQNVLICNICDEPAEEPIRSQCKHDFCRECAKSFISTCEQSSGDIECPRCHIALSIDLTQPEIEQDLDMVKKSSIINRIKMSDWTSSTKIEMLVYELYKLRSSKRTLKSIVFSQFTSMLQLVEWRLRKAGFSTVMLDGSMTPMQRKKSIQYFMENANVEVFLVSLKAGGVALNLTEASRVFIIDPWWNPAAEWQSADRVHRIGQSRPCVITRLVVEDSVESRMVQLQEKKANLIASTINKDKVAMDKLSPEDLQFLFRGT